MIDPPDWLSPDESYLVGISGGHDSIALHHWLVGHHFQNLTYCHLNHGLRGNESDEDEEFLRELLGSNLIAGHTDVADLAEREKLSLETAAREARHCFFQECARSTGIPRVLLAHHADDLAETILFNLLRGSGGPKGMQARSEIDGLLFLRPLLEARRTEISEFLSQHDFTFREDSSNTEAFAARNRLRHEAIPLLTDILKRDPVPALIRAGQITRDLEAIVDATFSLEQFLDPQQRIHLPSFRELSLPLQRHALRIFLLKHEIPEITAELIRNAQSLASTDSPPSINLPGGLRLRRKESRLFISP